MKKIKSLILLPLLGSLTLGLVSILNNKKAESVDASSMSPSNGIFIRVDSYGDIGVGSEVIFVTDQGDALDDVWGNPAYVHGGSQGVQLSEDRSIVTLTNSKATIFHVEEGTETRTFNGNTQGSYAFRADVMSISGERKTNVYFAHNEEEDYPENHGRNDYDYIGWFYGRDIAVQQRLIKESSWYLEFETEDWGGGVYKHVTHIRNCKNYENYPNSELGFTHRYADRFCSDGTQDVYIYKKYNESEYSATVYQNPTKTTYNAGEKIDLSGLQILINSPLHKNVIVDYNSNKDDFNFDEYAYGDGEIYLQCTYKYFKFAVPITVNKTEFSAYQPGQMVDYRGRYFITAHSGSYHRGLDSTNLDEPLNIKYDGEHDRFYTESESFYEDLQFEITKDSNNYYHVKTSDNYYLNLDDFSLTNVSTPRILIDYSSDGVRIKNSSGQYLCFDNYGGTKRFYIGELDDTNDVFLYKCPPSESEITAENGFVKKFLEDSDVCDPAGSVFSITSSLWSGLQTSFDALPGPVQATFVNLTYNVSEIENRSKEHAMSRYDYIYQKYHSSVAYITDFIGRSSAGTMQPVYNEANVSLSISNNPNNTVSLITITALCSVTSIGVLLIIKKRKAIK